MSLSSGLRELEVTLPLVGDVTFDRAVNLALFGLVGASGIPVDMAVVWVVVEAQQHYLLAQILAFAIAVTWNFGLNYTVTFGRPDGPLLSHYIGYVSLQLGALGVRIAVVSGLVQVARVNVMVASFFGIVIPSVLGFLGTERIFGVEYDPA